MAFTKEQEAKRDERFKKLQTEWTATSEEIKSKADFLASRSYSALSNPVSAPYFKKLHRQESPSKHYGEHVKKTGIKGQCVSFVSNQLQALPYQGAGDLFKIPISSISEDYGDEHGEGKPAIFEKDAWTTRAYTRTPGALKPKEGHVVSDFAGLRKQQWNAYMTTYARDSFGDLLDGLESNKGTKLAHWKVQPISDFIEKKPYNISLMSPDHSRDHAKKHKGHHIFVKLGNDHIEYSATDPQGKNSIHKMSFDELEKTCGESLPDPTQINDKAILLYLEKNKSDFLNELINQGHAESKKYASHTIFIDKKDDTEIQVIITSIKGFAGKPLKMTLKEIQIKDPSITSLDNFDAPNFRTAVLEVALDKGYLGMNSTEIDADLNAEMLLASFYRMGAARLLQGVSIDDRKLDCLVNRKLHELYGMGSRVNEMPIVYISESGDMIRDSELEKTALDEFFLKRLEQKSADDPKQFDLKKTIAVFAGRFFFTGQEGTESYKFSTNEIVEQYIFNEFKQSILQKYDDIHNKQLVEEAFDSVRQKMNEALNTQGKNEATRKDMQNIFRSLQLINENQDNAPDGLNSIFSKLNIDYSDVDPKSEYAVASKHELLFQFNSPKGKTEPIYKLSFPVSGIENLWKDEGRRHYYGKMMLDDAKKGNRDIIQRLDYSTNIAANDLESGLYIYNKNGAQHLMIKHLDGKSDEIDLSDKIAAGDAGQKFPDEIRRRVNKLIRWYENKNKLVNNESSTDDQKAKAEKSLTWIGAELVKLTTLGCNHNPLTAEKISLFAKPFLEVSTDDGVTYKIIDDLDEKSSLLMGVRSRLSSHIAEVGSNPSQLTRDQLELCQRLEFVTNKAVDEHYGSDDPTLINRFAMGIQLKKLEKLQAEAISLIESSSKINNSGFFTVIQFSEDEQKKFHTLKTKVSELSLLQDEDSLYQVKSDIILLLKDINEAAITKRLPLGSMNIKVQALLEELTSKATPQQHIPQVESSLDQFKKFKTTYQKQADINRSAATADPEENISPDSGSTPTK